MPLSIVVIFFTIWTFNTFGFQNKPDQNHSRKIIVLDPGHGGNDIGVIGPTGLAEKNIALLLAGKIKDKLDDQYDVFLTRTDDYNISAKDRLAFANHLKADLYISIHLGASYHKQARYWRAYLDLR